MLFYAIKGKFVCPLFGVLLGITKTVCMSFILCFFGHCRDSLYGPYLFQFITPLVLSQFQLQ